MTRALHFALYCKAEKMNQILLGDLLIYATYLAATKPVSFVFLLAILDEIVAVQWQESAATLAANELNLVGVVGDLR